MTGDRRSSYPEAPKLSDAQRAMLVRAVERGHARLKGQPSKATAAVLRRHGLVGDSTLEAIPTAKGTALVESWRCAACGHVEYHCPASGCNHWTPRPTDNGIAAGGDWCDCETFVPSEVDDG